MTSPTGLIGVAPSMMTGYQNISKELILLAAS
jgi:hypothetical protein